MRHSRCHSRATRTLPGRARPRGERGGERGAALLGVLIFAFVMAIIGLAFFAMAGYETRAAQQDLASQRAFWLAEAGRERCMRYLEGLWNPPAGDRVVYDRVTGPDGGYYSVVCRVDTSAYWSVTKPFVLDCVGESGGRQRRIRQRIEMISFAQYAYFTDDERNPRGTPIWFFTGDVIEGLVHSNGYFRISGSPRFLGRVTSAKSYMIGYQTYRVYDEDGWPVGGNNPYFAQGFELGVDSIPLPDTTADLRAAAMSGGVFNAPASTVELGKRASGAVALGWFRYCNTPPPGPVWREAQIALLAEPVFFSDGTVRLSGVLDGELTIGSNQNIFIVEDVTYACSDATGRPQAGCNDLLGLVSRRNIIFEDALATNNLKVNAILMALGTSITAENYDNYRLRGTLTIWGGLIQKYRGAVGLFQGSTLVSGYQKDYHYDPRVTARTPPQFPLTGDYRDVAWTETWDASDPF